MRNTSNDKRGSVKLFGHVISNDNPLLETMTMEIKVAEHVLVKHVLYTLREVCFITLCKKATSLPSCAVKV